MKDALIVLAASTAVYLAPVCGFCWNALIFLGAGSIASFVLELV